MLTFARYRRADGDEIDTDRLLQVAPLPSDSQAVNSDVFSCTSSTSSKSDSSNGLTPTSPAGLKVDSIWHPVAVTLRELDDAESASHVTAPVHALFPTSTDQAELYTRTVGALLSQSMAVAVSPEDAHEAHEVNVFMIGAATSGKTFTVSGDGDEYGERGLIPRAVSECFEVLVEEDVDVQVRVVCVGAQVQRDGELVLFDLFDESIAATAAVEWSRLDVVEGTSWDAKKVQTLPWRDVSDEDDALTLLEVAHVNRMVAEIGERSIHSMCFLRMEKKGELLSTYRFFDLAAPAEAAGASAVSCFSHLKYMTSPDAVPPKGDVFAQLLAATRTGVEAQRTNMVIATLSLDEEEWGESLATWRHMAEVEPSLERPEFVAGKPKRRVRKRRKSKKKKKDKVRAKKAEKEEEEQEAVEVVEEEKPKEKEEDVDTLGTGASAALDAFRKAQLDDEERLRQHRIAEMKTTPEFQSVMEGERAAFAEREAALRAELDEERANVKKADKAAKQSKKELAALELEKSAAEKELEAVTAAKDARIAELEREVAERTEHVERLLTKPAETEDAGDEEEVVEPANAQGTSRKPLRGAAKSKLTALVDFYLNDDSEDAMIPLYSSDMNKIHACFDIMKERINETTDIRAVCAQLTEEVAQLRQQAAAHDAELEHEEDARAAAERRAAELERELADLKAAKDAPAVADDAPAGADAAEFQATLEDGVTVLKHCRRGSPHERTFVLAGTQLSWNGGKRSIDLANAVAVFSGRKTPVLAQIDGSKEDKCFSIVTPEYSLNLETSTSAKRRFWLDGLQALLPNVNVL